MDPSPVRYLGAQFLKPLSQLLADGTRLMAQAQGQPANEMHYLGNYTFGVAFDPALRFTLAGDAGKATKATLLQGGATIEGPRVP